jgi:hypothetical protein
MVEQAASQLFEEMQSEDAVGLLLAAQLTDSPNDLQVIVRTTVFDKAVGGLRELSQYAIKTLGLAEHQITLGLFDHIAFIEDHPLLYHYNTPVVRVFIGSRPEAPESLLREIEQAHGDVYDAWRDLPMDLNKLCPPEQLFNAGFGLLGEMPQPFANVVAEVLTRHQVKHNLATEDAPTTRMKLLAIDDSYFIAADFVIEHIGPRDER